MLITLLACLAVPQAPDSDGNLLAAPTALFVDGATHTSVYSSGQQSDLRLKRAGAFDSLPGLMPNLTDRPRFRDGPWASVPGLEIDAFSTNINVVPADSDGILKAAGTGTNGWAGVAVAVDRLTAGVNETGRKAIYDAQQHGEIGADVFQFLYPDSVNVASDLVGAVFQAIDNRDIEFLNSAYPQIAGLDLTAALLAGEPNTFQGTFAGFKGVVFSVTEGTSQLIPGPWVSDQSVLKKGTTVFATEWTGSAWGDVEVLVDRGDLDLFEGQDLFALAWDNPDPWPESGGGPTLGTLLYSGDNPNHQAFMVVGHDANGPEAAQIKFPDAAPIKLGYAVGAHGSTSTAAERRNIRGICTVDPRFDWPKYHATPLPTVGLFGGTPEVPSSVWREDSGTGSGEELVAVLNNVPSGSFGVLYAVASGIGGVPLGTVWLSGTANEVDELRVPVPPGAGLFDLQWGVFDMGGPIGVSHLQQIQL